MPGRWVSSGVYINLHPPRRKQQPKVASTNRVLENEPDNQGKKKEMGMCSTDELRLENRLANTKMACPVSIIITLKELSQIFSAQPDLSELDLTGGGEC